MCKLNNLMNLFITYDYCYLCSPDSSPASKKSTMENQFGEVFVTKVEPAKPVIIRAEMKVQSRALLASGFRPSSLVVLK